MVPLWKSFPLHSYSARPVVLTLPVFLWASALHVCEAAAGLSLHTFAGLLSAFLPSHTLVLRFCSMSEGLAFLAWCCLLVATAIPRSCVSPNEQSEKRVIQASNTKIKFFNIFGTLPIFETYCCLLL